MVRVIKPGVMHNSVIADVGDVLDGLDNADELRLIRAGLCETVPEKKGKK